MKRLLTVFVFLTLLLLVGCAGKTPAESGNATEAKTEPTAKVTTAAETEHVHVFDKEVQSDAYLAKTPACGKSKTYYRSCACGERGTATFEGEVQPHLFGVSVSDAGVIERIRCTREGCAYSEQPNVILPSLGTFKGIFRGTDNSYQTVDSTTVLLYEKCTASDFENYLRWTQVNGFTRAETYEMGSNRYALCKHEKYTLYLSYLSGEGALRVYVGRSDDVAPAKVFRSDEAAASVQPALWQIDVDCKAAGDNGGMSYVLQLPDGKFIVIDGGYETDADANSIYRILTENKPDAHEKPIVAGWFITHMHIDHCGALRRFASLHRDAVEVEGFYYNFPYVNIGDIWPSNSKTWETLMASFEGATLYRKLHSGMQFGFSGATVTVLCTFEDVYPLSFNSGNDTSTVFQIDVAGQSILFLADAEYGESDRMAKLANETLKADIMQYAHHGYDKQCRDTLYKRINPTTVLWPMPIVNWRDGGGEVFRPRYEGTASNKHKENEWIRSADSVKKIIVMAEGTTKLELPYTPTGERNADYNALYREQRP